MHPPLPPPPPCKVYGARILAMQARQRAQPATAGVEGSSWLCQDEVPMTPASPKGAQPATAGVDGRAQLAGTETRGIRKPEGRAARNRGRRGIVLALPGRGTHVRHDLCY
jgi:hypothetical protein